MFKQFISTIVLFLTIGLTALAQVSGVSGKVVDENGEPLVGVSVVVKGTSTGTITTADGSYSLPSSVSKNATLVFSSIGYTTVEEPIGGRNIVNVQLATDEMFLDETVVVGYATMKKRDLVGAVDAVGHEVIADRASSNLSRALQGSVAGLNITFNDSKPSHAGSYNVRGTGSIGAGGSSLVLIDGVEGSMSMVNPQDVESVSVLKDASSTAV
ncbi:MAG: carboxypeptidase-like regulatory domain-containing protein, partial [Bacteroidales bacterium]|nr:carboxypeptidase-like regulatory domain-containing protein [Bacteroidales bacterium]